MNPQTAGRAADYQVYGLNSKGKRVPVAFIASYDAANNTVTLKISGGTTLFAKGGQISVTATGQTGVSSKQGVLLNPSYTIFTIAPKAKSISLA